MDEIREWVRVEIEDLPDEIKKRIDAGELEDGVQYSWTVVGKDGTWRVFTRWQDGHWTRDPGVWRRLSDGRLEILMDNEPELGPSSPLVLSAKISGECKTFLNDVGANDMEILRKTEGLIRDASFPLNEDAPLGPFSVERLPATVIIGRKTYDQIVINFSRRLLPKHLLRVECDPETQELSAFYQREEPSGQLNLFSMLPRDAPPMIPIIDHTTRKLLIIMFFFAAENPKLVGTFTNREILPFYKKDTKYAGHELERIRNQFRSIATTGFHYTSPQISWDLNYISTGLILGDGLDARYFYRWNPDAFDILTQEVLRGKKDKVSQMIESGEKYVRIPRRDLTDNLSEWDDNLRYSLRPHRFGKETSGETILKRWMRVDSGTLRRGVQYCLKEILRPALERAKERGDIGRYSLFTRERGKLPRKNQLASSLRSIRVIFFRASKAQGKPKTPAPPLKLTKPEQEQRSEILEWFTRKDPITGKNIHGTLKEDEDIEGQLDAFIREIGLLRMWKPYCEDGRDAVAPSPARVWTKWKKIRAELRALRGQAK